MAVELLVKDDGVCKATVDIDSEEIWQARIDLAAALQISGFHGYGEGIDNHFSALVPGRSDLFLINPYGLAFREVTAASIAVCDFNGNVFAGAGRPEATAFWIHARIHMLRPDINALFHTHMPYATSLCMIDADPFDWSLQTSMKFYDRIAIDRDYNGFALCEAEGDRIAKAMGGKSIVFMRNHGVTVGGSTIAEAWDDLYYLERAAETQINAMSTGHKTVPVDLSIVQRVAQAERASAHDSARLHFSSVKRFLDKRQSDYANRNLSDSFAFAQSL
ncbi:MAG TPA: aldolase [Paraburkholderia sp.]|jgi:ribulose-5-phosphate 4-epimerase/fuculose-1-phosphate aldolase|uniref:aldolase n=1 Tax=Paraburkholderia sp. TaxID=1926495 RepID=UPI002B4615D7|nr:aldolase [Paraburkholderia sp.]HKR44076.1 aldolase [Paraburkholderia sp.]